MLLSLIYTTVSTSGAMVWQPICGLRHTLRPATSESQSTTLQTTGSGAESDRNIQVCSWSTSYGYKHQTSYVCNSVGVWYRHQQGGIRYRSWHKQPGCYERQQSYLVLQSHYILWAPAQVIFRQVIFRTRRWGRAIGGRVLGSGGTTEWQDEELDGWKE